MNRILTVASLSGAALACAMAGAQPAKATETNGPAALQRFAGMWDVVPRRPPDGRGRMPPPRGADGQSRPHRFGEGFGNRPPPLPGADGPVTGGPKVEGLDRGDLRIYRIMTPAGRAAFDAMDPHDLPSNNCQSNGVPTLAVMPQTEDWSFQGPVLAIRHSEYNTIRDIYLDGRPAQGPETQLGHAVASLHDGVLTITTTHMKPSLGGLGRNAPGSGERSVVERYRLSADGQSMTGRITVHDPLYLTHDIVIPVMLRRSPPGTRIADAGCSVEASQRYLEHPAKKPSD